MIDFNEEAQGSCWCGYWSLPFEKFSCPREDEQRAIVSFDRNLDILLKIKIEAFSKDEELRADACVWMLLQWMTNPKRQRVEMDPAFVRRQLETPLLSSKSWNFDAGYSTIKSRRF